jgi:hypothetical protein
MRPSKAFGQTLLKRGKGEIAMFHRALEEAEAKQDGFRTIGGLEP